MDYRLKLFDGLLDKLEFYYASHAIVGKDEKYAVAKQVIFCVTPEDYEVFISHLIKRLGL